MASKRIASLLPLVLLLLLHLTTSVSSWKKEEFRNCNQTPFCKRARSRKPGSCSLIVTDVSLDDGDLTAKLVPKTPEQEEETVKPLLVRLSVHQDGILRLKIDEDPSLDPPKKRFQVPDVIVPEFYNSKLWLYRVSTEVINGDSVPSSIVYLSDYYQAILRHGPFEIYVRDRNGDRLLSMNTNGLFDFEQLSVRKEGDEWEETFRSHTDSRPYGLQSISFDVSFYGADFTYGIHEHVSSLALKPTKGPDVEFSEPYRLFNLVVFEYIHDSRFGLYGSIPFMISHGKAKGTSGFFWLNAAEMQIDVLGSGWDAEAGIVDVYVGNTLIALYTRG